MEVLNGVVLKPSSSAYCYYTSISKPSKSSTLLNSHVWFRKGNRIPSFRGVIPRAVNHQGFEDEGHLEYYSTTVSSACGGEVKGKGKAKKGWNGIPVKKRMKLLKGLLQDLSTFSDLGFGLNLDCDNQSFGANDDKSKAFSEAAETLLAQLKQLRAEEEQMKKSKSQDCESSSSSSSSESSDSECDEVIDMKMAKNKDLVPPVESKVIRSLTTTSTLQEQSTSEQKCCNMVLDMTLNKDAGIEVLRVDNVNVNRSELASMGKKVEVCMGGKCKKSGASTLMQEFQRVMGSEGVVEGCKCMGKCKTAPNVRVQNGSICDDSLRTSNPLCIGVGLEDVELIVANYFGKESMDQLRTTVAGLP